MASVSLKDREFHLQGQPIRLLSGAMHYFRVVPEYWEDRLLRMKAAGLNCLETYVPWNLHEEIRGQFNFEGILDIRKFIKMAQEKGFYVLLRPGPYICSEWDFGGLPSWLLHDPHMQVRSPYKPYLDAVESYFEKLLPEVADLQLNAGGPIIAVQIENEYGSYGDDITYKNFLKAMFEKYGITELFFTSDNGLGIQGGGIPDVLVTANFQEKKHGYLMFEYLKHVTQPTMPLMVMEFWTGWFDHWKEKHSVWPEQKFEKVLRWILQQGSSVNFYMFHGGTNFGFMNGANEDLGATNGKGGEPYAPDVTSYDYDAPIAENGDLTAKFHRVKAILKEMVPDHIPSQTPDPPMNVESTAYDVISVTDHMTLEHMLKCVDPISSKKAVTMEMLDINNGGGQGYGFILYRKVIGPSKSLKFTGKVKDRAIVMVGGKETDVVSFTDKDYEASLGPMEEGENTLDILVENCGRVNYANFRSPVMNDQRKGLREDVTLDGRRLQDWDIFPLEFKKDFLEKVTSSDKWQQGSPPGGAPALCRFELTIEGQPKDTFVNMAKGWGKGVVFVNRFNLGRYWEVGPQETLYLPGPLLKEGKNEIIVFELHRPGDKLAFSPRPLLGEEVIHKTIIPVRDKMKLNALRNVLRLGGWVWPVLRKVMK